MLQRIFPRSPLLLLSLTAFLLGICIFSLHVLALVQFGFMLEAAGFLLVLAYFLVLADNYVKKIPVQTKGGVVRYEDHPEKYRRIFLFMTFPGVLALLGIAGSVLVSY